jgi:membrane protein insertase Oxa1/YidC/SpoIIIJ
MWGSSYKKLFIMKLPKMSNGFKVFLFWLAIFAVLVIVKIFLFPG